MRAPSDSERVWRALACGLSHAAGDRPVRTIETRTSELLLAGAHAIKRRRPAPGLMSQSERARALTLEYRLNRRFSPDVYLGVYPLPAASLQAAPLPGWPIARAAADCPADWALLMRRLPTSRLLDHAIRTGRVSPVDIDRVAQRLRCVFAAARPVVAHADRYLARIESELALNRQIAPSMSRLLSGRADDTCARVSRLLAAIDELGFVQREALAHRLLTGCIVEGHGDLRPEHVCLTNPVELIDCLDFDRALRQRDPWEELCLLALMSEVSGGAWIGARLRLAWQAEARAQCATLALNCDQRVRVEGAPPGRLNRGTQNDAYVMRGAWYQRPQSTLLHFYTARQALTRARLAVRHLEAAPGNRPRHWQAMARRYFACAEAACEGWSPLDSPLE